MKQVFLTGYEKETIDEFLEKLTKNKITTVIDIREIPLSRKNGFSKNHLQAYLKEKNISYFHFSELGSPSIIREELRETGDYLAFFQAYRKYISEHPELIDRLLETIFSNGRSAIMCFEKHHEHCHRSIVASELLKCDKNLQISPL